MKQAIILVGGKGTRLSALYPDMPKALAPVAGRPFLQWQLDWLARAGLTHVHLATGHLANTLRDWTRTHPTPGLTLTLSRESTPLGTGGGLKFTTPHIVDDPFFVLNGDSLLPHLDFAALAEAHQESNALATLAVAPIQAAGRYGTVVFDARGRLTAFLEKTERTSGWVNGGVYLMRRALLEEIPAERASSLECDIFPALAGAGRLFAYPAPPPLLDMGTPDGLAELERYLQTPTEKR